MSLAYILDKFCAECGLTKTVVKERAFAINQINQAAKELYESRDLVGCEREQLFELDTSQQVITLPHYVGVVRAVRNSLTQRTVPLHDSRPRYKSNGWTESPLSFRVGGYRRICRDLLNTAPVTLTIPAAEAAAFSVVVGGPTEYSGRTIDTITFNVGEVSKQSNYAFKDIEIFSNPLPHEYDVTMTDVAGNTLALLPNWRDSSQYLQVQVLSHLVITLGSPYMVEILYKMAWHPMREDYDEFLCPSYDDAVYWKAAGNYKGKRDVNQAAACLAKAEAIVKQMEDDYNRTMEQAIDFQPNPLSYACGLPRGRMTDPSRWIEP